MSNVKSRLLVRKLVGQNIAEDARIRTVTRKKLSCNLHIMTTDCGRHKKINEKIKR